MVREDIKEIQGGISKLKYELQTDKKFTDLDGIGSFGSSANTYSNSHILLIQLIYISEVDKDEWNEFLAALRLDNQDSFYTSKWLYTECYMYRQIKSLFEKSYVIDIWV